MKSINIIGSGGHCRAVIPLLSKDKYALSVYDDSYNVDKEEFILGVRLIGKVKDIPKDNSEIVLAIGNNEQRAVLFAQFKDRLFKEKIIANTAYIGEEVKIGNATIVFHHALVNSIAQIGMNTIVNSKALIEHECIIGDHCHISISSVIGGRVKIGDHCFIGAGAIVKDQIEITDHVTIGAGGVVINSITEQGIYVGNPLRKIK